MLRSTDFRGIPFIMNSETRDGQQSDEAVDEVESVEMAEAAPEDTVVMDADVFESSGNSTAEVKVDELIAKIESDESDEARQKREAHRRLEALQEKRRSEEDLDSTYNINLDDD
jgi:hypothetical protein